jgi:uncharacterized protein (TIGR00296 family)
MEIFTPKESEFLVKLARNSVEEYLSYHHILETPKATPAKLLQKFGAFVTLNTVTNHTRQLRGCIGYPYPLKKLVRAVIESAVNAATQDPRFHPVILSELEEITFEISVLTQPQPVQAEKLIHLPSKITVGTDGLMVDNGLNRGLLLPQVPMEYKWNEQDFLSQTCIKAGLTPDCWLMRNTKIHKFQCIIMSEDSPRGLIKVKGPNLRESDFL